MKGTLLRILLVGGLLAALMLCLPWTLVGKTPDGNKVRRYVPDQPVQTPEGDEWTFSADRVVGDYTSEYVEAFGNCTLSLGDDQLRADFARYYQSTGWVFLKGNIRAHWGGDFLQADEGEFDLKNMTGWLKNGKLFMAKPHVYVEADHVEKHAGDTYSFKNAKVTACDGEKPAWSVTSEEGDVQLDGRVRLYRSAFRIKDVPVFYWPYMSLPGKKKRQSGFLIPYMASTKKLGMQINLPYYWVVSDEADMTLYQNFMSKRGYMQGVEFRHTEDESSKGMWKADFLNDKRVANTESQEWEDLQGDGLTRSNRNRWWVRGKYDGWLGSPKIKIKADLDLVSDQNYMRDFEDGPTGFEQTREDFMESFGRDINNKDEDIRYNSLYASRSWNRFGLVGKIEYNQNTAFMNGNNEGEPNTTVQTLPEIDAFAFQQDIPGTPLEVSAGAKYDYFHRNDGHSGHRLRVTPEVKMPLKSDFITVIPSLGIDHTSYKLSKYEKTGNSTIIDDSGRTVEIDTNATKNGFQARTTWTAGFQAFSEMTKVYSLDDEVQAEPGMAGTSRWTRLKHSVIPRVEYAYTPTITGQDELPYFDELDRIKGQNTVTYSLTNLLDRRRDSVILAPGMEGEPQASVVSDYLDFFMFRLEQSYDKNEADRKDDLATYKRRPFSDVMAELLVKPDTFIDILTRNWFSPYTSDMTQSESSVRLYEEGLGEITVGYDFQQKIDEYTRQRTETMSIVSLGAEWEVNDVFTLGAKYRHDFNSEQDLERTVSLNWVGECYTLHFSFSQKPNDQRFEVGFDLLNF